MGNHRRVGRNWAVLVAGLAALCCAPAGPVSAEVAAPALDWAACAVTDKPGFDCARAQVPLDHAKPGGAAITLSVIRHKATDPARRIGALFFNPGGPGGLGTADLPGWIDLFSETMRARFDLISWDPRGIGDSTAVQCFANSGDEARFFDGVPQNAFPVGASEKLAWIKRFETYGRLCLRRNGALLSHTSTADTARDMDLLRRAAGETVVNYLGTSYGTFLGAVYANLFPSRVRAMILDGNLSPTLYTDGGNPRAVLSSALRFGSDEGIAESLDAFLDQCGMAGPARCAFSTGDAMGTHAKFDALLQRLKDAPVAVGGVTITYALLLKAMEGRLFTTRAVTEDFKGWAGAGALLDAVDKAPAADATTAAQDAPAPGEAVKYVSNWQSLTVECGDSPNPRPAGRFLALDRHAYAAYGPIGVVDLWLDEPCSTWPVTAADQYVGPWNRPTPNAVLLIGNTHDPSTPYRNSVRLSRELAAARLLTVEGYGHTVFQNPSACASAAEVAYLVDATLPAEGTVCQQDKTPFADPVGA